jgi:hypothetical protein
LVTVAFSWSRRQSGNSWYPAQAELFGRIVAKPVVQSGALAEPPAPYRKAPVLNDDQDAMDV